MRILREIQSSVDSECAALVDRLRYSPGRKVAIDEVGLSRLGLNRVGAAKLGLFLAELERAGRLRVRARDAYLIVELAGRD